MHQDVVTAQIVVRTNCEQINSGTTCIIHASSSRGKHVIAVKVEKKGGTFKATDLQF